MRRRNEPSQYEVVLGLDRTCPGKMATTNPDLGRPMRSHHRRGISPTFSTPAQTHPLLCHTKSVVAPSIHKNDGRPTIYIQNSSALARREQELVKKGQLARTSSQNDTVTTTTLTTATDSQHTTFHDIDNDSIASIEGDYESNTRHLLSGRSFSYILEEESSVEELVYEDRSHFTSSSSTSGYISPYCSDASKSDLSEIDASFVDLSMSSLNTALKIEDRGVEDKDTWFVRSEKDNIPSATASLSENKSNTMLSTRDNTVYRPPLTAVVIELDDYTESSSRMGEETIIHFVKNFTEEMRDDSVSGSSNPNNLPTRPSVRLYSTIGTRRCDLKSMKQKVLSSEQIVSTILEERAKQCSQQQWLPDPELGSSDGSTDRMSVASTCSSSVDPPSDDSSSGCDEGHLRKFSKDFSSEDILASMRGEDILLSKITTQKSVSVSKASSIREKKCMGKVTELSTSTAMPPNCTVNQSHLHERSKHVPQNKNAELVNTLKEEAERRRQRLKDLRTKREDVYVRKSVSKQPPVSKVHPSTPPSESLKRQQHIPPVHRRISTNPPHNPSKKNHSGFGQFLAKLAGKKQTPQVTHTSENEGKKPMRSEGSIYREAIASRSKQKRGRLLQPKTPPRHKHKQLPSPQIQIRRRRGLSSTKRLAKTNVQPRRLFEEDAMSIADEATCTSRFGRCQDDVATSTALASAAWI